MGLDAVELMMAVEESFQIHVDDEEFQRIDTVGDLHRLVVAKLHTRREAAEDPVTCAKVPAFNRLRRAFVEVTRADRSIVRPSTPVEALAPQIARRAIWAGLEEHTGLRLPKLTAPAWLLWSALGASFGTCMAAYVSYALTWSLVLVFGGSFVAILKATKPLQVALPEGIATIGDLTRSAAGLNYILLAHAGETLTAEEIWDALVEIIVEQLCVKRSSIHPEASFVRDLGVD